VVCFPHQYQLPGHDSYLWQGLKCYQKRTCGRVLRCQKVSLGLGEGSGEKYGPISKNWGHSEVKIGFERRSTGKQKGE